jgi:hypothetical protein
MCALSECTNYMRACFTSRLFKLQKRLTCVRQLYILYVTWSCRSIENALCINTCVDWAGIRRGDKLFMAGRARAFVGASRFVINNINIDRGFFKHAKMCGDCTLARRGYCGRGQSINSPQLCSLCRLKIIPSSITHKKIYKNVWAIEIKTTILTTNLHNWHYSFVHISLLLFNWINKHLKFKTLFKKYFGELFMMKNFWFQSLNKIFCIISIKMQKWFNRNVLHTNQIFGSASNAGEFWGRRALFLSLIALSKSGTLAESR